jgi:hypothetical protein
MHLTQFHLEHYGKLYVNCKCYPVPVCKVASLKGQCHEIFDSRFFRQSITPRPLINTIKYFRILFRIRRAIRPLSLIPRYAA